MEVKPNSMPARDKFEKVILGQRRYSAWGRQMQEKAVDEHRRIVAENKKALGGQRTQIDVDRAASDLARQEQNIRDQR